MNVVSTTNKTEEKKVHELTFLRKTSALQKLRPVMLLGIFEEKSETFFAPKVLPCKKEINVILVRCLENSWQKK